MTVKLVSLPAKPDFKSEIFEKVGKEIQDFPVFLNRILVAKFIRTTVGTTGRILAAAQTNREDLHQGKVGLVLKKGSCAFKDDAANDFHGDDVEVGDWVVYSYSDGTDIDLIPTGTSERIPCRILKDVEIQGRAPRPDFVF